MRTVLGAGYAYRHPSGLEIHKPEGFDCFVFVYFAAPAEIYLEERWEDAAGRCIIFSPGAPQWYRSKAAPYQDDWVHFLCDEDSSPSALGLPVNALFDTGDAVYISRVMQNLQASLLLKGSRAAALAQSELNCLLLRLAMGPGGQAPTPNRYHSNLAGIRSALYSAPRSSVTVAELAAQAGLSVSHFHSLYKQQHGVAVGHDIVMGRLMRASYLLRSSDYSIAKIAEMSGFLCDAHFCRQFKKQFGVTPRQYRGN